MCENFYNYAASKLQRSFSLVVTYKYNAKQFSIISVPVPTLQTKM